MNIHPFVITIAIVLFAILHSGTSEEAAKKKSYKCYECDSRRNTNCTKNPTTVSYKNCSSNVLCGKCDYVFPNKTNFVIRGCGFFDPLPLQLLEPVELNNGDCSLCKGDLCNNANMATISMTALGCLVSFWAIRSILTNSYSFFNL